MAAILPQQAQNAFLTRLQRASNRGRNRLQFLHQLGEFLRFQALRAIRERVSRVRMHFDHQPIRARGDHARCFGCVSIRAFSPPDSIAAMRLSFVAAAIAAVIHVGFFALESFLFTKPVGRKIFRTTPADAETMKFFAFNQGFYNLFLAIGCAVGIALAIEPLVMFTCASMVGAAAVLATGGKQFLRGVALQGVPPLVALVGLVTS